MLNHPLKNFQKVLVVTEKTLTFALPSDGRGEKERKTHPRFVLWSCIE